MVSHIWTVITSVSSARIILRLLGPLGQTELPLQLLSSAEALVFAGHSISVTIKMRS